MPRSTHTVASPSGYRRKNSAQSGAASEHRRRLQRIKLATIVLLSAVVIAIAVWCLQKYFDEGGIHPVQMPNIRLGGDN